VRVTALHAPVDNVEVFRCWKALGYVAAKVNTFARYTHDDDRALLLRQLPTDVATS
jgi:hypothetical protein